MQRRWLKRRTAIIAAKKRTLKIYMGYILQLENDKWYIGISKRGTDRLYEHYCSLGAKWTKLHHPVAIHKIEYIGSNMKSALAWEKETTIEMMFQMGYKNVRGSSWCSIVLPQRPHELICRLANKLATELISSS